jgi:hypothetical protein
LSDITWKPSTGVIIPMLTLTANVMRVFARYVQCICFQIGEILKHVGETI